MKPGAFSISLHVKDLQKSVDFYQAIGFELAGDHRDQNWCVMRQGTSTIGLFHGMFEHNILTFNPGWAQDTSPLDEFDDVRDIQSALDDLELDFVERADPMSTGPAHIILHDPDGNVIMFDQHVSKADS
jgi:catechol 2,3-dioxygenase-like lactoylglutathione lyase family enzyme